jgi:hypothetical protein
LVEKYSTRIDETGDPKNIKEEFGGKFRVAWFDAKPSEKHALVTAFKEVFMSDSFTEEQRATLDEMLMAAERREFYRMLLNNQTSLTNTAGELVVVYGAASSFFKNNSKDELCSLFFRSKIVSLVFLNILNKTFTRRINRLFPVNKYNDGWWKPFDEFKNDIKSLLLMNTDLEVKTEVQKLALQRLVEIKLRAITHFSNVAKSPDYSDLDELPNKAKEGCDFNQTDMRNQVTSLLVQLVDLGGSKLADYYLQSMPAEKNKKGKVVKEVSGLWKRGGWRLTNGLSKQHRNCKEIVEEAKAAKKAGNVVAFKSGKLIVTKIEAAGATATTAQVTATTNGARVGGGGGAGGCAGAGFNGNDEVEEPSHGAAAGVGGGSVAMLMTAMKAKPASVVESASPILDKESQVKDKSVAVSVEKAAVPFEVEMCVLRAGGS